jgi:DNA-binding NtrC family response regulator
LQWGQRTVTPDARHAVETGTVEALVGRTLLDVERRLILKTLEHCEGNRTRAARMLGISLRNLRNKLRDYAAGGITVPPPRPSQASAYECSPL